MAKKMPEPVVAPAKKRGRKATDLTPYLQQIEERVAAIAVDEALIERNLGRGRKGSAEQLTEKIAKLLLTIEKGKQAEERVGKEIIRLACRRDKRYEEVLQRKSIVRQPNPEREKERAMNYLKGLDKKTLKELMKSL